MKIYTVTVTSKYPAFGERPSTFEIEAQNAKEAVSKARRQIGWQSRQDGPLSYRAEVAA